MPLDILLVADSRGKGLQSKVNAALSKLHASNISIRIEPAQGATLSTLLSPTLAFLAEKHYDVLIVMAGVNDLSHIHWKEDNTSRVSPKYYEVGNLVEQIIPKYELFKQQVQSNAHGTLKILFAELIGLSFEQWNESPGDYPKEQLVISQSVELINQILWKMNKETGFPGPHLQNSVHELKKGRRHHKYKRIPDGLHADTATAKVWAHLIAKNAITLQQMIRANFLAQTAQL